MASFTIDCTPDGRLVSPVAIANIATNQSLIINGEADTGASHTVIHNSIVETLGLTQIDEWAVHSVSETVLARQYPVAFGFARSENDVLFIGKIIVTALPLPGMNGHCLVGKDILSQGMLIYNGYMNRFSFSF